MDKKEEIACSLYGIGQFKLDSNLADWLLDEA